MSLRGVDPRWLLYGGGLVIVGLVGWKLYSAATGAANAAGRAVSAVDQGVATSVGAVGAVVGLPTPSETIDDPAQVRYIADRSGWFAASKWGTALALFKASTMGEGSGTAPPMNSPAAQALGYDRTDWAARPIDFGTGDGW